MASVVVGAAGRAARRPCIAAWYIMCRGERGSWRARAGRPASGQPPPPARTSSTKWWANQYRLLLAGLACLLLETMRRTALRGTALARSRCRSLRPRLLRIGAVVTRNTRTVAVRLSGACPDQGLFRLLVQRLTAG